MSLWHVALPECSRSQAIQPLLAQLTGGLQNSLANMSSHQDIGWIWPIGILGSDIINGLTGFLAGPVVNFFANPFWAFSQYSISVTNLEIAATTFLKNKPFRVDDPGGFYYRTFGWRPQDEAGPHTGILAAGRLLASINVATSSQTSLVEFVCEYDFDIVQAQDRPVVGGDLSSNLPVPDPAQTIPGNPADEGFVTLLPTVTWLRLTDPQTGTPNDQSALGDQIKGKVLDFLQTSIPKRVLDITRQNQQISVPSYPHWLCDPSWPVGSDPDPQHPRDPRTLTQCQLAALELYSAAASGWAAVPGHLDSDPELTTTAWLRIQDPDQWSCRPPSLKELQSDCATGLGNWGRCQFAARMTSVLGLPDEFRVKPFEDIDDMNQNGLILFYAALQSLTGFDEKTYPGPTYLELCNPPIEPDPMRGYYVRNFATVNVKPSANDPPAWPPPSLAPPPVLGPCACGSNPNGCAGYPCVNGVCAGLCLSPGDCQAGQACCPWGFDTGTGHVWGHPFMAGPYVLGTCSDDTTCGQGFSGSS